MLPLLCLIHFRRSFRKGQGQASRGATWEKPKGTRASCGPSGVPDSYYLPTVDHDIHVTTSRQRHVSVLPAD